MAKVCTKCNRELPEINFSKRSAAPDGLRFACKDCTNKYYKQYLVTHREKNNEHKKQYHADHKEEERKYLKQHKEHFIAYRKQRYTEHGDDMQKASATWRKNNQEAHSVHEQARRSKKAGLARTLTSVQWKHILDKFNNTCAYCGVGDKKLQQEHFISLSSGGEYTHDNIIPACGSCNSSKNAKGFREWYPTSNCYDKQREKKIIKFLHYTGNAQQLTLFGE